MAIGGPDRQFSLALGRVGRHDRAQSPNPRDSALLAGYVKRNAQPVGLVKRAEEWPWSSVHACLSGQDGAGIRNCLRAAYLVGERNAVRPIGARGGEATTLSIVRVGLQELAVAVGDA